MSPIRPTPPLFKCLKGKNLGTPGGQVSLLNSPLYSASTGRTTLREDVNVSFTMGGIKASLWVVESCDVYLEVQGTQNCVKPGMWRRSLSDSRESDVGAFCDTMPVRERSRSQALALSIGRTLYAASEVSLISNLDAQYCMFDNLYFVGQQTVHSFHSSAVNVSTRSSFELPTLAL